MVRRFLSITVRLSIATAVLAVLGACAQPVTPSAMVPDLAALGGAPAPAYRGAITVGQVSGGRPAPSLGSSQVDDPDLREALIRTLMESGLGQASNGRFRLDAVLQKLEQPFAGFAMTVTATIAYRLMEVATGTVVYDNTLVTPGTATLDDAIDGRPRLRIANERAVRANLQRLVEELYALPDRPAVTSSRRT